MALLVYSRRLHREKMIMPKGQPTINSPRGMSKIKRHDVQYEISSTLTRPHRFFNLDISLKYGHQESRQYVYTSLS